MTNTLKEALLNQVRIQHPDEEDVDAIVRLFIPKGLDYSIEYLDALGYQKISDVTTGSLWYRYVHEFTLAGERACVANAFELDGF